LATYANPTTTFSVNEAQAGAGAYALKFSIARQEDSSVVVEKEFTFTLAIRCDSVPLTLSREVLDSPIVYKLGDPTYSKDWSTTGLFTVDRSSECGTPVYEFKLVDGSALPSLFSDTRDAGVASSNTFSIPQTFDYSEVGSYQV
jgi:hypothetical protein